VLRWGGHRRQADGATCTIARSRAVLAEEDLETRLLAGDCYARGLRGIAARGRRRAVGLLARLMAACAYLRCAGTAADDALWAYTTAGSWQLPAPPITASRSSTPSRRLHPRRPADIILAATARLHLPRAVASRARRHHPEVMDLRAFISLLNARVSWPVRPVVDPYLRDG
jgi:hypothetical protein